MGFAMVPEFPRIPRPRSKERRLRRETLVSLCIVVFPRAERAALTRVPRGANNDRPVNRRSIHEKAGSADRPRPRERARAGERAVLRGGLAAESAAGRPAGQLEARPRL